MALNVLHDELDTYKIDCHVINEAEQCKTILNSYYNFKVLTFNIRSIGKNFDNLLVALGRLRVDYDIICLTECRLNAESVIPQIPGFTSYRTLKIINQNSGVVVYVKDSWNAVVCEPEFEEADCLLVDIPNVVTILAVYRSPSFTNLDPFLLSLESTFERLNNKKQVILTGDININISSDNVNGNCAEYLCLNAEFGFLPAVTLPTRGSSVLDHIFVKTNFPAVGVVCKLDLTDHDLVMLGMNLNSKKCSRPSRITQKRDIDAIVDELSTVNWTDYLCNLGVNDAAGIFASILTNIIDKHTITTTIPRSKFNLKPWVTPGLMRCMRNRDRLHMRAKANPKDSVINLIYTRYRNFYVDLMRKIKHDYESKLLLESKGNVKRIWRTIRSICHLSVKNKEPTELLSVPCGSSTTHSLDSCNDYFATVGRSLADKILTTTNMNQKLLSATMPLGKSPKNSFFMHPTDASEVGSLIKLLPNDKAPGIDGHTNIFIKNIHNSIVQPLTIIYNMSLSSGIFPEIWKLAVVHPIHKHGPKNVPDNYRPISLLGAFSKILEKIVNKRITSYLEVNKFLSERQFGFRRGRSTDEAVSLLTSVVSSHLDRSRACIGVFLDLARAFDTVSIPILLKKLEGFGVRGTALGWFESYLSDRRQCVRIGQHISNSRCVEFGVPQGSILGPTLFLMYMEDIHNLPFREAETVCYADDTAIIFHGSDWNHASCNAEHGLSLVSDWLKRNLLTLNVQKSEFLCFHKTSATAPTSLSSITVHTCDGSGVACSCEALTRTAATKYLGVVLDEKLNFYRHINLLSGRVRKTANILRLLRDTAPPEVLKMTYFALCQSLLTYCISSWGGAAKTHMLQLERAQRCVLKTMLNKPRRYPTSDLYREADVLSVRRLFILKIVTDTHRRVLRSADYGALITKRMFHIPLPSIRSSFAKRFHPYISAYLYNNVLKSCNIKLSSAFEAKRILNNWLRSLTYDYVENLIVCMS